MKEVTKTISVFEAEDGTCFEKKKIAKDMKTN